MELKRHFQLLLHHAPLVLGMSCCFIIGQLFFSYKGVETLPFFNYGMYSAPTPPSHSQRSYTLVSCYNANGKHLALNHLPSPYPIRLLQYQLHYYQQLKTNQWETPVLSSIQQRLGKGHTWEAFFLERLHPVYYDTAQAEQGFIQQLFNDSMDIFIRQENYKWVKNKFSKVTIAQ